MNSKIILPDDWAKQGKQKGLVAEGDYTVIVECIESEPQNRLHAEYRIQDPGLYANRMLSETFAMDTYAAKFFDLLLALGINEQAVELEPEQLNGMTLRVTVKHRKDDDGKTWANIVAHHPQHR